MIIHCSGGIGRSGTFTALYSLYRLLLQYHQVTGGGAGLGIKGLCHEMDFFVGLKS